MAVTTVVVVAKVDGVGVEWREKRLLLAAGRTSHYSEFAEGEKLDHTRQMSQLTDTLSSGLSYHVFACS